MEKLKSLGVVAAQDNGDNRFQPREVSLELNEFGLSGDELIGVREGLRS